MTKTGLIVVVTIVILIIITGGFFLMKGDEKQTTQEIQTEQPEEEIQTESRVQTYNIEIKGFAFNPKNLKIKQGDIIIWTNKDFAKHTVTSDSGNELDSKLLAKGESYSHTFDTKGEFPYYCIPHPYMTGTIAVE
jgi:plastocyanin